MVEVPAASASASAANSEVNFTNAAKVATAEYLEFEIDPVDSTGMALLDASGVAYFAELAHPSSSSRRLQETNKSLCSVSYIATTKRHLGLCVLPEYETGTFTLTVIDIEDAVVGVLPVTVSRCAAGSFADADGKCVECSKRLDCLSSGLTMNNLQIVPGGYRFDESTEIVRDCLMGERACPGGNGTGNALCARGYEGPLCAVCSEGFILGRGNKCIGCASSDAITSISTPLAVLAALLGAKDLFQLLARRAPEEEVLKLVGSASSRRARAAAAPRPPRGPAAPRARRRSFRLGRLVSLYRSKLRIVHFSSRSSLVVGRTAGCRLSRCGGLAHVHLHEP